MREGRTHTAVTRKFPSRLPGAFYERMGVGLRLVTRVVWLLV
jgi:hypothetical protein